MASSPRASLSCHHWVLLNHTASPSFCKSVWWRVRKLDSGGNKQTNNGTINDRKFIFIQSYTIWSQRASPDKLCISILQGLYHSNSSRGTKFKFHEDYPWGSSQRRRFPWKLTVTLGHRFSSRSLKTGSNADAGLVAKEPAVLRRGMQTVNGRQQPYF